MSLDKLRSVWKWDEATAWKRDLVRAIISEYQLDLLNHEVGLLVKIFAEKKELLKKKWLLKRIYNGLRAYGTTIVRSHLCLDQEASIGRCFKNGQSVLHFVLSSKYCRVDYAASRDEGDRQMSAEMLRLLGRLLEGGADPNAVDEAGVAPLRLAVHTCYNYDATKLLLQHGAKPHGVDFARQFWSDDELQRTIWPDATLQILRIVDLLGSKGYSMSSADEWTLAAFFIDPFETYDFETFGKVLEIASSTQIRKFGEEIEKIPDEYFQEADHGWDSALGRLRNYSLTVNECKMPIPPKMSSLLDKLQKRRIIDSSWSDVLHTMREIESTKEVRLNDHVTLHDVCRSSLEKTYRLSRSTDYCSDIYRSFVLERCKNSWNTVKAHITRSLMRKFFTRLGIKWLARLTDFKLTAKAYKVMIQPMENDNIRLLFSAPNEVVMAASARRL